MKAEQLQQREKDDDAPPSLVAAPRARARPSSACDR
jgi:hypothetical protein